MDSLIEAAEKTFEAKLPLTDKCKLAMKVIKLSLFKRVLSTQPENARDQYIIQMAKDVRSKIDENVQTQSKTNYDQINSMLSAVMWVFWHQHHTCSFDSLEVYTELISLTLKLKKNNEVSRLISLANNLLHTKHENLEGTESELVQNYLSLCSHVYNLTKNVEKAVEHLKYVDKFWKPLLTVESLFDIVECCMKTKKDTTAENIVKEYIEYFGCNPEHLANINYIMIKGFAKMGKFKKAVDVFLTQFDQQFEKKFDQVKYCDTRVLNDLIDFCVSNNKVNIAENLFKFHLNGENVVNEFTINTLVKGYCRSKQMDKALAL